jgi:hypothetical protein
MPASVARASFTIDRLVRRFRADALLQALDRATTPQSAAAGEPSRASSPAAAPSFGATPAEITPHLTPGVG